MGSNLIITSSGQQFTMNVTGFSSPVFESISSSQTRTMAVYYPVKMSQPDIQFDVQFASQADFMAFQVFVRTHQQNALLSPSPAILSWPERNINNFTGFIQKFQAGGMRAQYAPTARFTVSLVDSTVSTQTIVASIANPWMTIYGMGLVDGVLGQPSAGNTPLALNSIGESTGLLSTTSGAIASTTGGVVTNS